jgi:aerobic-type carbon monoxide dehydrogenase small subunit (CoxS/CutS family)
MKAVAITLTVNNQVRNLSVDPRMSLLDVVREELGLTGTKYGCGEGQCAACTVLVDDKPVMGCQTPIGEVANKKVMTIEGLAKGDALHPVQEAFLAEGAFQCGYCTAGMIMGAVGLLIETPHPTEAQVRERMNGHLCRCGGYARLVKAVHRAGEEKPI